MSTKKRPVATDEIRSAFLEFFRERDHVVVPSAPLIPENDPTLLFTNAGMVPFKEVFLGREERPYKRATSCQKCLRAGGKHNDLENVGYTARHHTFFEMLGNFSFGDYFKREAIHYAWELVTELLQVPRERLWITVYAEDDEAARIWLEEIGIPGERLARIAGEDNFWSMGEVGPCGPCSEIFYDHGPSLPGSPPGSGEPQGDRYVEIWNLVFMQFNRKEDGTLEPLPRPSVDTGMGLERIAAVQQGVHSNYEIDLFRRLIGAAAEIVGTRELKSPSLRVIADHIRAAAFLIAEGLVPSNEGRGYVLRRIIRRAARHGYLLGRREPFFYRMVSPLVEVMGHVYPELPQNQPRIEKVLEQEEERFGETLARGERLLEEAVARLSGKVIPGELIFKLYDTYGFPVDLVQDFARERGLQLDLEGFEREMEKQRARARAASPFKGDYHKVVQLRQKTRFVGYETLACEARVTGLLKEGEPTERLRQGEEGAVLLDTTPFYAEGGGQVGDRGIIEGPRGRFLVEDTQRQGESWLHLGRVVEGEIALGDRVRAEVDREKREATARHHTATHLLHAALRKILGTHVQQKGSLVAPDRLRFDFSHFEPLKEEELFAVERLVNEQIVRDLQVEAVWMAYREALQAGALAFFGEKYGERVRVLRIGDFSIELCGGTHVGRTGEIGFFKILSESGVAAGIRRIEAVAGLMAVEWAQQADRTLRRLSQSLKTPPERLPEKGQQLLEQIRALQEEVERLKQKLASAKGADLLERAREIKGVKVVAALLEEADPKSLRSMVDQLKQRLGSGVVVLATRSGGKGVIVAGVTPDLTQKVKAGELVNLLAQKIGGRGGGRADFAQAGGPRGEALPEALAELEQLLSERL